MYPDTNITQCQLEKMWMQTLLKTPKVNPNFSQNSTTEEVGQNFMYKMTNREVGPNFTWKNDICKSGTKFQMYSDINPLFLED